MDDPTHNVWATPHDIALQQMEYARRQEAARKQQARAQAHDTRQAAPNQQSVDDLTAWMGGLGYGQSAPDPAQLQAATELRQM